MPIAILAFCALVAVAEGKSNLAGISVGIPPNSAQVIECFVSCTPAPVERNGVLCVPLRFLGEKLGCRLIAAGATRIAVSFFGTPIVFTGGSRVASVKEETIELSVAPFKLGSEIYVPTDVISQIWGVRLSRKEGATLRLACAGCCVQSIRYSVAPEKTRLVIDLSHSAPYSWECQNHALVVRIPTAVPHRATVGEAKGEALPLPGVPTINDILVRAVRIDELGEAGLAVCTDLRYRAPVKVFHLPDPPRIVIDCEKIFEERTERVVAPGVKEISLRFGTSSGPVQVNAVRATLRGPAARYRLRVLLGGNILGQRNTPSSVAQSVGAVAAINGGYFAGNGAQLGTVVTDGEWIKTGDRGRTGVLIDQRGQALISNITWAGDLVIADGAPISVAGLNTRNGRNNGVLIFTRRWGDQFQPKAGETVISVSGSRVINITSIAAPDNGAPAAIPIPPDGFLIVGSAEVLGGIQTDKPCQLRWRVQGIDGNVRDLLEAGPRLVERGQIHLTDVEEGFKSDITVGRAPRSAFGITSDRDVLLVTVDGRNPVESIGATLQELATIMIRLGASEAMNLDGGSSSTLVVAGEVHNKPSGGNEKRVPTVLALVPE